MGLGDEACPFCEDRQRDVEPLLDWPSHPWKVRILPNLYPAVGRGTARGFHDLVIECPQHRWAESEHGYDVVMEAVQERVKWLVAQPEVAAVQWYKNHGYLSGASLKHPHSQILATDFVPERLARMVQRMNRELQGRVTVMDRLRKRAEADGRLIASQEGISIWAPWAPRVNHEVWLMADDAGPDFDKASREQVAGVGAAMERVSTAWEKLFPGLSYNCALFTRPDPSTSGFTWHVRMMPRFAVPAGYEMATDGALISAPPKQSAEAIREAWT